MTNPAFTLIAGHDDNLDCDCDVDLDLELDLDEDDDEEIDPETARIIDEIMVQRDAMTDPQQRADLVLAALGYRLADAAFIALTVDEEDCFVVEAVLDADGTIIERCPEDDCLASNLEITDTGDDSADEPDWALPEMFQSHWIPSADRVAAGITIANIMTWRAATADLRALWSVDQ